MCVCVCMYVCVCVCVRVCVCVCVRACVRGVHTWRRGEGMSGEGVTHVRTYLGLCLVRPRAFQTSVVS